jgi:hypothetical protein
VARTLLKAVAPNEVGEHGHVIADSWDFFAGRLSCDPQSLERAAKFFDLDHKSAIGRSVLAAILADVIFGTRSAGRRRGATAWNNERLVLLGRKYCEAKAKNPTFRKDQILELICKDKEFGEYQDHRRGIEAKNKKCHPRIQTPTAPAR